MIPKSGESANIPDEMDCSKTQADNTKCAVSCHPHDQSCEPHLNHTKNENKYKMITNFFTQYNTYWKRKIVYKYLTH